MANDEIPQIYLILPPSFELAAFPARLSKVLDRVEVACLRLDLSSQDPDRISRSADAIREVAHARDLALVISDHVGLVRPLGLDGVHLTDGPRALRAARKELGTDAIVGAFCGASRHDGLTAGEAGAEYVAFGPVGQTPLGHGEQAETDLFAWWTEMIEVPVVAEGALSLDHVTALAPMTDFFGIGPEIWDQEDPAQALFDFTAPLR